MLRSLIVQVQALLAVLRWMMVLTVVHLASCEIAFPSRPMLKEEAATDLPVSFDVIGASVFEHQVFLWSAEVVLRVDLERETTDTVGVVANGRIAGVRPCAGYGCIEVVDGATNKRHSIRGRVHDLVESLPFDHIVSAAAGPAGRWIISGAQSPDEGNAIYLETERGRFKAVAPVADSILADNIIVPIVAGGAGQFTISSALAPFASYIVDEKGRKLAVIRPASRLLDDTSRAEIFNGDWLARPAVDVRGGYIQTFVHRKSASRIHAFYDPSGTLISSMKTSIPVVFIGRLEDSGNALAVRRTNRLELVTYIVR